MKIHHKNLRKKFNRSEKSSDFYAPQMAGEMGRYSVWSVFKRNFKIADAEPPQDIKDAFNKYSEGEEYITAEQLRRFLVEFQGEFEASVTESEQIVKEVLQIRRGDGGNEDITPDSGRIALRLEDFHHFLFSADQNPPIRNQVHHDMTAPLSHYFIFTGHNSYLTGNQLSSDCSDAPIIEALKKGVRVVELDLWPNKDDVHVLHGRTLTPPVELMTCLESIRENAFLDNPFPVIITLEDHLTPKHQEKVAQMIHRTFEDMLFFPESECLKEFPSPEELKNKIIISTKPPKQYQKVNGVEGKGDKSKKGKKWRLALPVLKRASGALRKDKEPSNLATSQEDDDKIDVATENEEDSLKGPKYKHLIAIHAGKPKGGVKDALRVEPDKVRRLSLSEQKFDDVRKSYGTDIVRFTQKNVLRIYPKGSRIDSSNFNPLIAWMYGAQMVAFNMQGNDKHLWLMQGMFRANGGYGYVKKPDFLTNFGPDDRVFDPKARLPVKKTLKVKIYMGDGWNLDFSRTHFDSCSPPDFYTRIGMKGVHADKKKMQKTKTAKDKWTPVWNEEFTFKLTVPELALLRVDVYDADDMSEKDDFAGQTCLPVSELKLGIRAVPLFDKKGKKYNNVRLLMRFDFV